MKGPRHGGVYEDRFLDCEMDLESDVLALLGRAEAAGWGRSEAIIAISSLADNIALGDQAIAADWDRIREAMRRNRKGR